MALVAQSTSYPAVDAKLRLRELHDRRGLTELEEAWLVRSLDREDQLPQPEIARRMQRHPSWVWRRLMLLEAIDPLVQTDVRLGLIAPRAAVAVSRLPRGNQQTASAVVVRRGLTFRQTEALVDDALGLTDPAAREALLVRRLDGPAITPPSGPRPSRAVPGEADWISVDIVRVRDHRSTAGGASVVDAARGVRAGGGRAAARRAHAPVARAARARWCHRYGRRSELGRPSRR